MQAPLILNAKNHQDKVGEETTEQEIVRKTNALLALEHFREHAEREGQAHATKEKREREGEGFFVFGTDAGEQFDDVR